MSKTFTYAVFTALPLSRAWKLFTDIGLWPSFTGLYRDLRWEGEPWQPGSAILGRLVHPLPIPLRYVIRRYQPEELAEFIGHSTAAGFATNRSIRFSSAEARTQIQTISFGIGSPPLPGGMAEFIGKIQKTFLSGFAEYCDQAAMQEVSPKRSSFLRMQAASEVQTASADRRTELGILA